MKGIIVTRDDIHEILLVMVARSLNYKVLRSRSQYTLLGGTLRRTEFSNRME